MMPLWVLLPVLLGQAEVLKGEYRAVTVEPGIRVHFRVPGMERVTGSSGRCLEEGTDTDEPETFWVEATCGGVRTSMAWKKDGTRVHLMACAEPQERTAAQVKLRKAVQAALPKGGTVTACVRNGKVELWGWVRSPADLKKATALEQQHGREKVRSFVEVLE